MPTFLIRSATFQSISYPIVLTRLDEPRSRPNPHLKLWKCQESNPQPHVSTQKRLLLDVLMHWFKLPLWLNHHRSIWRNSFLAFNLKHQRRRLVLNKRNPLQGMILHFISMNQSIADLTKKGIFIYLKNDFQEFWYRDKLMKKKNLI